jgi:hypothetical protein
MKRERYAFCQQDGMLLSRRKENHYRLVNELLPSKLFNVDDRPDPANLIASVVRRAAQRISNISTKVIE